MITTGSKLCKEYSGVFSSQREYGKEFLCEKLGDRSSQPMFDQISLTDLIKVCGPIVAINCKTSASSVRCRSEQRE